MRDRAVLVTAAVTGCAVSYLLYSLRARRKPNCIRDGYVGLVGNTPMIRIKSLSDATGCEILAKVQTDRMLLHRKSGRYIAQATYHLHCN
jgi:hypothetical protein